MIIYPIYSKDNFIQPNFKSNNRHVYTKTGRMYQNYTRFFRHDLNWENFINYLKNKYQNIPKVNVFNLACSDGSEPWSLAILLLELLKDDAEKFFPIQASDIDEEIINLAKYQPCEIVSTDLYKINKRVQNNYSKYFICHPSKNPSPDFKMALEAKPFLKQKVNYKVANAIDEIKNIPSSNSVVLCRNAWIYFQDEEKKQILQELSSRLDSSSCIVIGELDAGHHFDIVLERYGFQRTSLNLVFENKK